MRCENAIFSRKNKHIALLSKWVWYFCAGIKLLETSNLVIICVITVPGCDLQNGTTLSKIVSEYGQEIPQSHTAEFHEL